MSKYINAEKLIDEIERLKERAQAERVLHPKTILAAKDYLLIQHYDKLLSFITSLQQDPRFPQYDNIVDKVFGAGNLEGFEYREAEMLVALAKEELLKSFQQKQPVTKELSSNLEHWLAFFGCPEENIEKCATQISQGYGAILFLEGVQHGAEAVNELAKQEQPEVDLDALVNEAFDKYSSIDGYGQLAVSFNRAELYSFIKKITRKDE